MPPPKAGKPIALTTCDACPLRPLKTFRDFTGDELDFIRTFKSGELAVEPGASILLEGNNSPHLYTILSGWVFRYKTLEDGRRQILNFGLPGDFLGLQSSVFNVMGHSVEALSRTTLCVFPREKIWALYEKHAGLGFDITWLAAREERFIDQNLLNVGRRTATERIAFTMLSLFHRAKQVSLTQGAKVAFPFTQQHLADSLGLSVVHTNKVLKRLAQREIISWKSAVFEILDEEQLNGLAAYDVREPPCRPLI